MKKASLNILTVASSRVKKTYKIIEINSAILNNTIT